MCEILMELMKDDVEAIRAKTWEEACAKTREEATLAVTRRMLSQHHRLFRIVQAADNRECEVWSLVASVGAVI
jgi:hypothetical protein